MPDRSLPARATALPKPGDKELPATAPARSTAEPGPTPKREVAADYWKWLRAELQKARLDLLVVLVPGKYTVYRPFLVDQRPVGPGEGNYLDRLERELRAAGVPVLNLTPFFSAEAARLLERGEYLYWPDDIHWNARGVALAATAIRERWPLAEVLCRNPRPLVVQKP